MPHDEVTDFHGCSIQHGLLNKRVYIMKWNEAASPYIVELEQWAINKGYTKIFAKIPQKDWGLFEGHRYIIEASIPEYFSGEDCLFIAKYLSEQRSINEKAAEIKTILDLARTKIKKDGAIGPGYVIDKAAPNDAEELSSLYKTVFASYPFPIDDADYISKTMGTHIDYYIVKNENKIIAASSAEKDLGTKSVEMTDFATLPEFRGNGLASFLLKRMEHDMRLGGIKTFYTIARALSAGMNITFAINGYVHAGTLFNNTFIHGDIESMNVWYKNKRSGGE